MQYLNSTQNQRQALQLFLDIEKQFAQYSAEKLAGSLGTEYANLLFGIANKQLNLKQYEQAKASFHKALERIDRLEHIDEESKNALKANIYHNLGAVAQEQRKWEESKGYYQQALQIFVEYNDRYEQAGSYHQLGRVAQEQRKWIQARDYLLQALEIFVNYNDNYSAGIALQSLALLWQESKDASLPGMVAGKLGVSAEEAEKLLRDELGKGNGGTQGEKKDQDEQ